MSKAICTKIALAITTKHTSKISSGVGGKTIILNEDLSHRSSKYMLES